MAAILNFRSANDSQFYYRTTQWSFLQSHNSIDLVVSDKKIFKISANENTLWTNQHQKHKSGRGPSSEHFWQVWLISVQRFQRRRFKCEKLTDGRRLPMTKAHMAYGQVS
jgi:hypothetical protein